MEEEFYEVVGTESFKFPEFENRFYTKEEAMHLRAEYRSAYRRAHPNLPDLIINLMVNKHMLDKHGISYDY